MNRTLTLVLIGIMILVSFYTLEAQINSNDVTKKNLLTTWKVPLAITGDGATFTRTFGGDPGATDEFDTGLDVTAAPPGMTYYAYFAITQFPNYLDTDIRAWLSPYKTDIDWTLKVINASGKTTTVSWDPNNLPVEGSFTLEGTNGSVDMRTQNLVTFSGDKEIMIKYRYAPPVGVWAVPVTITGDGVSFTRTFGGNPNGTEGFDTGMDVTAAPPGMSYYAYFEIIQFPNYLDTDIRGWVSPYKTDIDWTLKVVNAAGKTTTMSWDPANLPSEGTFTLEGANGSVDMRIHSSVTFSGDRILTIMYRESSSITITSPNGAELWLVAGSYDITWTSKNFTDPVKIEYSIDGGVTWLSPPIAANTPNDGSYSWTVPNTPSNNCKVRVSDAVDGDPWDVSDDVFAIVAPSITVTSPDGGELWAVAGSYDITWISDYFTDPVKIEYSIDGGVTWVSPAIVATTTNDGSHPWTIPNTPSNNCKVRISDAVDGDPSDISNDVFSIAVPPIKPLVSSPQNAGQEFWVEIKVGSVYLPVTNLFGLNFDFDFTHTNYIDVSIPYANSVIAGDFLGTDVIFFSNVDETVGKVSVGVTRKAGAGGVNGEGVIAKIKLISDFDTPDNTIIDFSLSNVTANDPHGNPINLDPESVSLVVKTGPATVIVWPGDTNNDGIVNTADVLPIGLYFGSTGTARPEASIDWVGQRCVPWTPVDATYADADGNSIIDTADVLPISSNYGKTHSANLLTSKSLAANDDNTSLTSTIKPEVNFISGDSFRVDIKVQEVTNLFGLSFELQYSQEQYVSPISVLIDPFIGSDLVSLIHEQSGKVSVGVCRKYGQGGVDNSGTAIQILMIGNNTAPSGTYVDLSLLNVAAIDLQGNSINFKVENSEFITSVKPLTRSSNEIPIFFHLSQNYPNPFNPQTNILFQIPKKTRVVLKIFDILGQEICTLINEEMPAGYHEVIWDGRDSNGTKMASGIYIYILKARDFIDSRKMIFMQ